MQVFIVYAHPSENSFTFHVKSSFIKGLNEAGHKVVVSDLYKMGFLTDISEAEYLRESNYIETPTPLVDVLAEQEKIQHSDAIVFIYPIFWTEAPAKLVGWFDRVWTYGFAYGTRTMKKLDKALVIATAGHTLENLKEYGHLQSMRTVMLGDRLHDRAAEKDMIILDAMTKQNEETRNAKWEEHIERVYRLGLNF